MTDNRDRSSERDEDVLQRNIEGSRRVTDQKRKASAAAGGPEPKPEDEAQQGQQVPPGQDDVPAGGSSGSEMNLGGGYKSQSRH